MAILTGITLTAAGPPLDPQEVLGGAYWRISTSHGPVHVWRPTNFDRRTAGVVIYVHGYFTDLDTAWTEHQLPRQFADSGLNALFIAPEAPSGANEEVIWKTLPELFSVVRRASVPLPRGPTIVVGHSGAYRTIVAWLVSPRIREIILLDGLYENENDFERWLRGGRVGGARKLILVGYETVIRSEAFCSRFRFATKRANIPEEDAEFTHRDRRAKLLYFTSQHDHMAMVTEGTVIPMLLRLTLLRRIEPRPDSHK